MATPVIDTSIRAVFRGSPISPAVPSHVQHSESHRFTRNFLLVADFALVWCGSLAAWWFRFVVGSQPGGPSEYWPAYARHAGYLYLYAVLFVLFAYARKLYVPPRRLEFIQEVFDVLKVSFSAAVTLSAFIYASKNWTISREVVGGTLVFSFIFLIAWRAFLRFFPGVGVLTESRNVLIIGAGEAGRAVHRYLTETPQLGYSVKGYTDRRIRPRDPAAPGAELGQPILGPISELDSIIRAHFIDEVLITLPTARDLIKDVVLQAQQSGTHVRVIPDLYDGLALAAPLESMGQFPTVTLHCRTIPALQLLTKNLYYTY